MKFSQSFTAALLLAPLLLGGLTSSLLATQVQAAGASGGGQSGHGEQAEPEPEKGPHRGRLLRDGDFTVELAIFETGVPPEFRVWADKAGQAIAPQNLELEVRLIRLGNQVDQIGFRVEGDYLRGDMEIYEPHSFVVEIDAKHNGTLHQWRYDNFEGRTQIANPVAAAMEIETEIAGPQTLHIQLPAWGELVWPNGAERKIQARFDGEIRTLHVTEGERVKAGDLLFTVESNKSLKSYSITAPISGVVTALQAGRGEQTAGRTLLTLLDTRKVQANLAIFPQDQARVKTGMPVSIQIPGLAEPVMAKLGQPYPTLQTDQSRLWRVTLPNPYGSLAAGQKISAEIEVAAVPVELAVKRSGLQAFRDFTVVYAKVGEEYEVRMLELGQAAGEWIQVLGGLKPGTEYVTKNSFIIKADIEKSGASHDH
tara:strand:+ start:270 stop:1544 length:1275 start_codon:yes stop_codon:yes gene_type:complete